MAKKVITRDQIEEELYVCPYCMSDVRPDQLGCCGESSCHFETAYLVDGEALLESEVTIRDEQVRQGNLKRPSFNDFMAQVERGDFRQPEDLELDS